MKIKRLIKTVVLFVLVAPLTYCAFAVGYQSGPAISGTVTDLESGKPIPGATVVWQWKGRRSMIVDSQTLCYHVSIATTDENGRYVLPSWHAFDLRLPYIYDKNDDSSAVYKPGYSRLLEVSKGPSGRDTELKIKKFAGTDDEYLNNVLVNAFHGLTACAYAQYTLDRKEKSQVVDFLIRIRNDALQFPITHSKYNSLKSWDQMIQDYDR